MSRGPGKIERVLRALIEDQQAGALTQERPKYAEPSWRPSMVITTEALCKAAFGGGPWTKAQRVSVLRTMRRIIAAEPTKTAREHWRIREAPLRRNRIKGQPRDRWLRFAWTSPPLPKPKPVKVHEEIWAISNDPSTGQVKLGCAVITSRGGAKPNRITVEWGGVRWQTREYGSEISAPDCELYSETPQFYRTRVEAEARRRRLPEFGRAVHDGRRASGEALAMLDLRPPFTRADVQKAYRTKSLKAHPDQGGDAAFMRALVMARDAALADADD